MILWIVAGIIFLLSLFCLARVRRHLGKPMTFGDGTTIASPPSTSLLFAHAAQMKPGKVAGVMDVWSQVMVCNRWFSHKTYSLLLITTTFVKFVWAQFEHL
jgi:hypothetical protein